VKWIGDMDDPKVEERRKQQKEIARQLQAKGRPCSAKQIEAKMADKDKNLKYLEQKAAKNDLIADDSSVLTAKEMTYAAKLLMATPPWGESTPRKPLEPELTVVEPIIGWRRWSVEMFGNELRSNNGVRWTPYEKLTAECKKLPSFFDPTIGCKGVHCTCGIYAYKTPEEAKFGKNAPRNLGTGSTDCWGEVYLWGRVIEHEKGWRAQYAYPKSFVDSGIARQLATVYGCKVIQDTWEPRAKNCKCLCLDDLGQMTQFMPDGTTYTWCSRCGWQEYTRPALPMQYAAMRSLNAAQSII